MMENAKRIVSDLTGIGVALIALGVVLGVVSTDVAFVPNGKSSRSSCNAWRLRSCGYYSSVNCYGIA